MRTREEIQSDIQPVELKGIKVTYPVSVESRILEVLLDIRDLLTPSPGTEGKE